MKDFEKSRSRVVDPEVFLTAFEKYAGLSQPMPLVVTGSSMSPFLCAGRDRVFLSKPVSAPVKGDIVLYRRLNGEIWLHRVYDVKDGVYSLVGDRQIQIESGIPHENLLAVVTAVERKGKMLTPESVLWRFFANKWLELIPKRPLILKIFRKLKGEL